MTASTTVAKQSAATAKIPVDLEYVFGRRPVLQTEDPKVYDRILDHLIDELNPQNYFEWFWVKDCVDLIWDILRYRIAKAKILEVAMGEGLKSIATAVQPVIVGYAEGELLTANWFNGPDGKAEVRAFLTKQGLDDDAIMAQALLKKQPVLERIELMLASAEHRRNSVVREFQHHREFARKLRQLSDEIIDCECSVPLNAQIGH